MPRGVSCYLPRRSSRSLAPPLFDACFEPTLLAPLLVYRLYDEGGYSLIRTRGFDISICQRLVEEVI